MLLRDRDFKCCFKAANYIEHYYNPSKSQLAYLGTGVVKVRLSIFIRKKLLEISSMSAHYVSYNCRITSHINFSGQNTFQREQLFEDG